MLSSQLTLDHVRRALAAPRAGRAAQQRMSPRPRPGDRFPLREDSSGRQAAVMILLYWQQGELYFFLTRRTENVATHKGQISLPGGACDPGEPPEQTARREVGEELGLDPARIELLGAPLTPLYIPASDYWVTPFVGVYHGNLELKPALLEVVELVPTRLGALLDDSIIAREEWEIGGVHVEVPFFLIEGHKVWGATAMILSEFAVMLGQVAANTDFAKRV